MIDVFRKSNVEQSRSRSDIHTVVITVCGAVFCNCLNCQLQQAFNKCKSICVCSLCSQCSEIFTDEQCDQAILWIKLVMPIMMKITTSELLNKLLVKLQPLSCKCSFLLGFHSLSSFENSANVWLVAHLAHVNVDKVTRNYVCFGNQNFHVRFSRFRGLSRCYRM